MSDEEVFIGHKVEMIYFFKFAVEGYREVALFFFLFYSIIFASSISSS